MDLVPCGTCGRNFSQDALTRHSPICKKNAKKKPRKQFDAQKNRLVGTEVNINEVKRKEKQGPSLKEIRAAAKKNNWKEKHADLINTIRYARGAPPIDTGPSHGSYGGGNSYSSNGTAPSNGRNAYSNSANSYSQQNSGYGGYDDSPPNNGYGAQRTRIPGAKSVPAGYLNCSHCGRNFAEETAERHIPWCAEQQKRKAMKTGNAAKQTAAQKMAIRTQYKPPKPNANKRNSSGGSSGYGVQSSGYGVRQNNTTSAQKPSSGGYSQSRYGQKSSSNGYFDDDLLGNSPKLVAPSAGRRADKQSVLSNLNREKSACSTRRQLRKNCGRCSTIYPVDWAKYCCECGAKRI